MSSRRTWSRINIFEVQLDMASSSSKSCSLNAKVNFSQARAEPGPTILTNRRSEAFVNLLKTVSADQQMDMPKSHSRVHTYVEPVRRLGKNFVLLGMGEITGKVFGFLAF